MVRRGEMRPRADTGLYHERAQQGERVRGERLLDRGEVGHLREGLAELDPGLSVDAVSGEAVGARNVHSQGLYRAVSRYSKRRALT